MVQRDDCRRILFIIGSMRRGGAERVISILANHYAEKGWSVIILTLLDNSNDYDLHPSIEVKPLYIHGKSRIQQIPNWIFGIRKIVKLNKPIRIVSFVARINILTILACLGLNQYIVISERNDPMADGRSIFVRFTTYLLYPLANSIVFQTNWAQSCFPKNIRKKSIIIPNPIKVGKLQSREKSKKIVAVGRLTEQKNHELLIRAFQKIHLSYPGYKLCIYGEGELREKLVKLIQQLSLNDAVSLPGNVKDIHEQIADAEMFVLSSNYEGLSNALLEAMMIGIPCISTNCAGSNEVIQDGVNGLLVPIGSSEKLVEAMKKIIEDQEFASKLASNAKKSSIQFNYDTVLEKWESVIFNKVNDSGEY